MLRTLTILVPTVALAACVASNNSDNPMVVLQNSAIPSGQLSCSFGTLGVGSPLLPFGEISTLSTNPYILAPLIQSRITATAGEELQRTILIQGADVTLTVASPAGITLNASDAAFQSLFSGSLAPNMGTTNEIMNLIPATAIATIAASAGTTPFHAQVVANIKVFGTLAGDRVESLPFQYPVTVCNDCIINELGPCPIAGTVRVGNPCNIFQDSPVDCCRETNGTLTCPARMQ
jgi:hypothetical protein